MKPNFLIIGAAKCGTTSLASALSAHLDCCMSQPKEVCFFQDTIDSKPNVNYEKGWPWYQKAFDHYKGESAVGEATPAYSDRDRSPLTAQRIYDFNPGMKIIYLVRDPLNRQLSAWRMQWAEGTNGTWPDRKETQWALEGFDSWMQRQEAVGHWAICRYSYQLLAYRDYFPAANIFVSFLEDWQSSKTLELQRIMLFLGLEPAQLILSGAESENRGADRTIERPLLKKIRTLPQVRTVVQQIPSKWRLWARAKIAHKQAFPPPAHLSPETQSAFSAYVHEDAIDLLSQYDKPVSLWPSVAECAKAAHTF